MGETDLEEADVLQLKAANLRIMGENVFGPAIIHDLIMVRLPSLSIVLFSLAMEERRTGNSTHSPSQLGYFPSGLSKRNPRRPGCDYSLGRIGSG